LRGSCCRPLLRFDSCTGSEAVADCSIRLVATVTVLELPAVASSHAPASCLSIGWDGIGRSGASVRGCRISPGEDSEGGSPRLICVDSSIQRSLSTGWQEQVTERTILRNSAGGRSRGVEMFRWGGGAWLLAGLTLFVVGLAEGDPRADSFAAILGIATLGGLACPRLGDASPTCSRSFCRHRRGIGRAGERGASP
jgi:hypothetical protein